MANIRYRKSCLRYLEIRYEKYKYKGIGTDELTIG